MTVPTIFEGISAQPEATSIDGLFFAAESSDVAEPTKKVPISLVLSNVVDKSGLIYKGSNTNSAVENMIESLNLNPLMHAVGTIIKTGGTTWEYLDSTGPITIENFRAFNCVNTLDCGVKSDHILSDGSVNPNSTDNSPAIQYAINLTKNAFTNGARIYTPAGNYKVTKPALFNQKDGIIFEGDGRWATKFYPVGDMMPDTSLTPNWPADGSYKGYTYTDKPCVFMIAARRVTGTDGDGGVSEAGNNAAAWFLQFNNFSVHGENGDRYKSSVFYAPEIAHTKFSGIFAQYMLYGWDVCDIYRVQIENCDIHNSRKPINHFSSSGQVSRGTTLNISNTGATRTTYGWEVTGINYSSWDNVAVDHWGYDQEAGDTSGKWAYSITDSEISMNGCGAESGSVALNYLNCRLLSVIGSRITMDNCELTSNFNTANNLQCDIRGKLILNNSTLSMSVSGSPAKAGIFDSGSVETYALFGLTNVSEMFQLQDYNCQLTHRYPSGKQDAMAQIDSPYDFPVTSNFSSLPHDNKAIDPQGLLLSDGSGFNNPTRGTYLVEWDFDIGGSGTSNWQFAQIRLDDTPQKTLTFDNEVGKSYRPTMKAIIKVPDGGVITWGLRNINGTPDGVVNNSFVSVTRLK